ncbi:HNH endonuclease [Alteromonas oceani]|jgi:5-methylcytosine-specific restriction endonuclease McrA|uniref:HNH endonuclease n=1 Tax=Alteromonas oceani TaxID=2071609 RepID=A0ABV7JYH1_9ALTE|nr:HNH endonuclease [Alteromonas oceani]MAD09075.1 restriction endonuclease [Alteromonas sp.]HCV16745.1 restriction endonuclease [Alteromonas sp.]|tara:strand:+ start:3733 stop:4275 length:543 start_codon:yes stop_codon:yes gene_type:complete
MLILRLNKAGAPQDWLDIYQAARYYAQNKVLFELGNQHRTLLGGWNREGQQSQLRISSIIACDGKVVQNGKIALTNRYLFRRDNYLCLYCGNQFRSGQLTRDHIIPRSRGGKNNWQNVATACARCNHQKGARTPEEANMPLLAVPFAPNLYERFYLMNRRILADQMDFLSHHFSQRRAWL